MMIQMTDNNKKNYVPYEESSALKDIGYAYECSASYSMSLSERVNEEDGKSGPFGWEKGELSFSKGFFINNYKDIDYTNEFWLHVGTPLWQEVFRWFRDKHGLKHDIDDHNWEKFYYSIKSVGDKYENYEDVQEFIRSDKNWENHEFTSYEDAELGCLKRLIQIVKNKQDG